MKLTVTVDGLDTLVRIRAGDLTAQLDEELERELQASATLGQPLDADTRRAAFERALRRLQGRGNT